MPRVLSYTPAWLSRSAPGFRLFAKEEESRAQSNGVQQTNVNGSDTARISSQRRVIAHRGSEVFVAVDGTIRWGDLATIKDEWESKALSQALSGRRGASVEDDEGLLEGVTHKVLVLDLVLHDSDFQRRSFECNMFQSPSSNLCLRQIKSFLPL